MTRAQELKRLRESNGKKIIPNEFVIHDITAKFDNYYESIISDEDIAKAVAHYGENIDLIDREFKSQTKMNGVDIGFLITATALQCVRQYLFTDFRERLDDQTAAKNTEGHIEEHSDRKHQYYRPSLKEVITNPVPFDANIGANGALANAGMLGHRAAAIGHDPILGLVIGTANIATSTLTNYKLQSYHIKTGQVGTGNRDVFGNKANTALVISKTMDKIKDNNIDYGKGVVAAALIKEVIHLKSDVSTKHSLPLPFVSVVNPQIASELAEYGFDTANGIDIGKQAADAVLINTIISMIHRLYGFLRNRIMSKEELNLYKVRTKRILLYSNLFASSSNVIYCALTNNLKKLDVGGFAVTAYRLFSDPKFIQKVKYEYINNNVSKIYKERLKECEFYLS